VVTYCVNVIDLLVAQVAREARHVGRARADSFDDLKAGMWRSDGENVLDASASPSPSMV